MGEALVTVPREASGFEIAVIGMAGRFPGAPDIEALWRNLRDGVEGIRRLSREELLASGHSESEIVDPLFVAAHGVLDGFDEFDAGFFGLRALEAELLDPQHRLFLEVAWQALEDAGIDPARSTSMIGVFAGSSADHYLYENLRRNPAVMARAGDFLAEYSNLADHLAPRASYKLGLSGPSIVVQSACSTSLVAVHLACQQLITGGCDVALAGGVSVTLPAHWGYRYEDGMIRSPDGHCRAFDAAAQGCLKGDGVGVVVLKRLADAIADGDRIDAVILGSACNNDGSAKVGYTAPGLEGQMRVIEAAQAMAAVEPDSIGLVEAHGTGTPLGDPIEIGALTRVFRRRTQRKAFCGIGSIKTGIGHLDAAAGVAGLIKAVLALRQRTLPASLHFRQPNPAIDFAHSPFEVLAASRDWPADGGPRRAAVSAFGIGGTNAHLVLEQAPEPVEAAPLAATPLLLTLSARSAGALEAATQRLAERLADDPGFDDPAQLLAAAHTLLDGRQGFEYRRALVAASRDEALHALRSPAAWLDGRARAVPPQVVFMFPGQGAQHADMGRALYEGDTDFRALVDDCAVRLQTPLGVDIRELLYPAHDAVGTVGTTGTTGKSSADEALRQTRWAQPALFVVEYALARWLMQRGVEPAAMVGHSLGELVCACLAGVFSLDDALALVALRGRLMQAQPEGSMLAVPLPREQLLPLLDEGLALAAENAPGLCVAAGPPAAIARLAQRLATEFDIEATRLHTSHAFHSAMMEPAVAPFAAAVAALPRQAPQRRYVSTVSGRWIGADEATAPQHWARNVRDAVEFAASLTTLFALGGVVLVEVGPGTTLGALARKHPQRPPELPVIALLRHPRQPGDDQRSALAALGRLWAAGQPLAAATLLPAARRRRVGLPSYPFERQRYWVDAAPGHPPDGPPAALGATAAPSARVRLYLPTWTRSPLPAARSVPAAAPAAASTSAGAWLLLTPTCGAELLLREQLRQAGLHADAAGRDDGPAWRDALDRLSGAARPAQLVFIAGPQPQAAFDALLEICRALASAGTAPPLALTVVAELAWTVLGSEPSVPEFALLLGLTQVLPLECDGVSARFIDVDGGPDWAAQVLAEARVQPTGGTDGGEVLVAWRNGWRWRRSVEPVPEPRHCADGTHGAHGTDSTLGPLALPGGLRERGVYLVSGGLGGIGLVLAVELARRVRARLVLVGRSAALPPRAAWSGWRAEHGAADATSRRIDALVQIEALGGEWSVEPVDVADAAALAALRARVLARHGALHGIVHAAGVAGGAILALLSAAQVERVFAAKVQGTRNLLQVFGGDGLDFILLCSSLTSLVPRPGRAEYSAANLFMDALATTRAGAPTISVNWDSWREHTMGSAPLAAHEGLSDEQGAAAFLDALALGWPQLAVAVRELGPPGRPLPQAAAGAEPGPLFEATAGAAKPAAASETAEVASLADDRPDAPRSRAERVLAAIWQELLGLPRVGIHDDFFELGGDSVVSIQVTSRARRAGLAMSARHLFEHRSIAALALVLRDAGGAPDAPPAPALQADAVPAELPLTPIQRWFFDLNLARPEAWALRAVFEPPAGSTLEALQACLAGVLARHDAFGLRFERDAQRGWVQYSGGAAPAAIELFSAAPGEDPAQAVARAETQLLARLDLARGPLIAAAFIAPPCNRLLLVVHHLVADLIALRVLAEDLADALDAPGRSTLASSSTPWHAWTRALAAYAAGDAVLAQRARWADLAAHGFKPLPRDHAGGSDTAGSACTLARRLDAASTSALINAAAAAAIELPGAVLGALVQALCAWSAAAQAWIDVEGHGRAGWRDDLDVARTAGWFTTLTPLVVAAGSSAIETMRAASQRLQEPARRDGLGFGLLRYVTPDAALREAMAGLPRPEVVLLYQGQLGPLGRAAGARRLRLLELATCAGRDAQQPRSHALEVNARFEEGELRVDWGFSEAVYRPATITALAEHFERALRELLAPAAAPIRHAPLSFAQERIWFLQQMEPASTLYNKQAALVLDGALDLAALQQALDALVERHATLRTRFVAEDGVAMQVAAAPAPVPIEHLDAGAGGEDAARQMAAQRVQRPFDLAREPALRVGLVRVGPARHWLLLDLHHIVTDAWSFGVLIRELGALYGAGRRGEPLAQALPRLTLDFGEFASWQRRWLSGELLARLLAFWTTRLAGIQPLELPTDRLRPPVQSYQGQRLLFRWPAVLTAALRKRCRDAGVSPFMLLLALFQVLLRRHSGQDDLVIGAPAIDRSQVETEGLIAPLVNNLVLRTSLAGNPRFDELLQRVRETVLAANEHRDLPFEKLVEALHPQRDRSRSPLFQAMFAYMTAAPVQREQWDGLLVTAQELDSGNSEFDLGLYCYAPGNDEGAQLSGWIEYASALFDASTIERLAQRLQRLAQAVADDPTQPIDQLPLLSVQERALVLQDWQRPARPYPEHGGIHGLFEAQARQTPQAIAVQSEDGTLSYAELDGRADQLARHLLQLGIGAEQRVVLGIERGLPMMVGLLGILKAGAAYVPVDPAYPAERIRHMVEDSGASLVITSQELAARFQSLAAGRLLCLDSEWPLIARGHALHSLQEAGAPALPPLSPLPRERLAYVIYTSGSTGKPKGVQVEHGSALNFLHAMRRRPGLSHGDHLLAVTTISFDIHVLELFLPLAVGARVVLAGSRMAADAAQLAQRLAGGITVMQATPSTWRMLVDAGWRGDPRLKILCGGEALPPALAAQLLERCGALWNMYGPTEATVWSSAEQVLPGVAISVGCAIDNLRYVVLDALGQPQPPGVPGELWIGGAGVARGYLGRPELTAERFRADPFDAGATGRLYGSGDMARLRADGKLEVLGRLDTQAKLRGHRIELGEIESVLAAHPAVAQCVALVREDRPGDQRLVAYVIGAAGQAPDAAGLRAHAARSLPEYMLPQVFIVVASFPFTANGKIDRRALPAPRIESAAPAAAAAPLSEAEQLLARIFCEVLGLESVGRYDNFFDLGGHSLLSMKVVDLWHKRSGLKMQPGELFQQTVGQIAAFHAPQLVLAGSAAAAKSRGLSARVGSAMRSLIGRDA